MKKRISLICVLLIVFSVVNISVQAEDTFFYTISDGTLTFDDSTYGKAYLLSFDLDEHVSLEGLMAGYDIVVELPKVESPQGASDMEHYLCEGQSYAFAFITEDGYTIEECRLEPENAGIIEPGIKNNYWVTLYAPATLVIGDTETEKDVKVKYDANGGIGEPQEQIKILGTDLVLSEELPEKSYEITYEAGAGHVYESQKTVFCDFLGWNTKPDGSGTMYEPGDIYDIDVSSTLYAQWENPCIGELPYASFDAYDFDGWYTSEDKWEAEKVDESTIVTADMTIYAAFSLQLGGNETPVECGKEVKIKSIGNFYDNLILFVPEDDGRYCIQITGKNDNSYTYRPILCSKPAMIKSVSSADSQSTYDLKGNETYVFRFGAAEGEEVTVKIVKVSPIVDLKVVKEANVKHYTVYENSTLTSIGFNTDGVLLKAKFADGTSETFSPNDGLKDGRMVQVDSAVGMPSYGKQIMGYSIEECYAEWYFYFKEPLAPESVKKIKAAYAGKNRVKLTWDAVDYAQGYLIYGKKNGKYAYVGMTSKGTAYTDTKAMDSDYNFYWVFPYVKDSNGKLLAGGCEKYAYAKGVCPAVTNLKASSVKGGVKLTWTAAAGAEGYLVYGIENNGKYGYVGMTKGTTYTAKKASKDVYNYYWIFPYHKNLEGKMITGGVAPYTYGRAK